MGTMTIDGRKVEFADEKTSSLSSEKPVSISLRCATIPNFQRSEPVGFVQWKMTEERHLHPVPKNQETGW